LFFVLFLIAFALFLDVSGSKISLVCLCWFLFCRLSVLVLSVSCFVVSYVVVCFLCCRFLFCRLSLLFCRFGGFCCCFVDCCFVDGCFVVLSIDAVECCFIVSSLCRFPVLSLRRSVVLSIFCFVGLLFTLNSCLLLLLLLLLYRL